MAVARKSAVSTRSTWFRQGRTLPLGKRRSASSGSAVQNAPTSVAESAPVPAQRRRRSAKNLAVAPINRAVTTTSAKELGKQPVSNLNGQTMSTTGAMPVWLLRLSSCNRYLSVVAFLSVTATLVVYGWTVYSQELWSQGYRRLQNLQRHERQLKTTNATLSNKMAEEGEQPTTGLVSPNPEGTIFLTPAPDSPSPASSTTKPSQEKQQPIPSSLGY